MIIQEALQNFSIGVLIGSVSLYPSFILFPFDDPHQQNYRSNDEKIIPRIITWITFSFFLLKIKKHGNALNRIMSDITSFVLPHFLQGIFGIPTKNDKNRVRRRINRLNRNLKQLSLILEISDLTLKEMIACYFYKAYILFKFIKQRWRIGLET
uniref:Uncharacterized protein n=1 Tax=Lepeophtheirus salmonis TaxID=72036 RepID=A0A0K2TIX3_LEPSM